MRKSIFTKLVSGFLVGCFTCILFVPPAEAKPHDKPPKAAHHQEKHAKKYCGDIVIDVLKCSRSDFDRACRNRMTLEDYIVACYIADRISGHDFEDVFHMHKNGKPYKEICKAYGINWGSVRSHMNHHYDLMSEDALRAGLIMWGLHEILR